MSYLNIDPTLCRGKFTQWGDFGSEWIVERKYNGDRRVEQFTQEKNYFTGRRDGINSGNKRDVSDCIPKLSRAMPKEFHGLILDGELYVPGGNNSDITEVVGGSARHALEVLSRPGHPGVQYTPFDILAEPGRDLTLYTWEKRRLKLEEWARRLTEAGMPCTPSPVAPGHMAEELYKAILEEGGEGVVLKWRKSKYADQRYWIKVKPYDSTVVRCIGFKMGQGKYEGLIGSLHFIEPSTGYGGSCSGMTDAERESMTVCKDDLLGRMFELRYTTRLVSGAFQNPRFLRWIK